MQTEKCRISKIVTWRFHENIKMTSVILLCPRVSLWYCSTTIER